MDDRPLRRTSPNDQLDTVLCENTHEMIMPRLVGSTAGRRWLRAFFIFFGGGTDRQTLTNFASWHQFARDRGHIAASQQPVLARAMQG
jgi:hypothetical protein